MIIAQLNRKRCRAKLSESEQGILSRWLEPNAHYQGRGYTPVARCSEVYTIQVIEGLKGGVFVGPTQEEY